MSSRLPIIVILGATGTGKSKLAVKIAKRFRGEIISADSMQVYEGLNIVSNKITESEKEDVPHYLLDVCQPTDRFSVLDFRNRALAIIDETQKRGKVPIIVGGTTYYIESVLWNTLMEDPSEKSNDDGLIFDRCRIMNDASKLRTSRWNPCRKAMSHSLAKEKNSQDFRIPANRQRYNLHSDGDVEVWCRNIAELEKVFEDSIRDTVSQLRLDFSHYRRTFYRLPQLLDSSDANESDSNVPLTRSENYENITENLSVEKVVRVEKQLLSQLLQRILEKLSHCLEEMSCAGKPEDADVFVSTTYRDVSSIWNEENMYNTLLRSSRSRPPTQQKDDALPQFAPFNVNLHASGVEHLWKRLLHERDGQRQFHLEDDPKNRMIEKCRDVMNRAQTIVHRVLDIRVKRLALLRIIDDENMVDYSTTDLHHELKLFDCKTGDSLHPNDRRKIIRAIQLYMSTGKTVIQLRREQSRPLMNTSTCGDDVFDEHGLSLRYPNALVLWLRCDQDVLNERLTRRVDEMLSTGLIDELETFHERYNRARLNDDQEVDYTKGIFQLIGVKEFHSYLMLKAEDRPSNAGLKELRTAVERLKKTNIQYSKSQNRHILNRFVNVPDYKQVPLVFELDCTDSQKEREEVDAKAFALVENYLKKETSDWWHPYAPMARISADLRRFTRGEFFCDNCQRLFTNEHQLDVHNASRSHKKRVYEQRIRELRGKISTLEPPSSRCNHDEDVFVDDVPWQEWTVN